MVFFSVSVLDKNAILLDTNAIVSEQYEILSQVGGNKMQIVTLYSSTIWELYIATLQFPGVLISKYIGVLISKYMNIARRCYLMLLFSVIGYESENFKRYFQQTAKPTEKLTAGFHVVFT